MSSRIRLLLCLILLTALSACGGGGNSSLGTGRISGNAVISGANVAPITIDSGPAPSLFTTVNEPFTSVTVCDAANNCQTIDHILIDTGSSGLRIISSVLSTSLNLTNQTDSSGNNIGACGMFADGYTWGPVKLATVKIANESTLQIPIQVIGESGFTLVPKTCSSTGPAENTVSTFRANGVLGVGYFQQDCGSTCANTATAVYYSCTSTTCTQTALPTTQQITNPVSQFAVDNNGVMLSLPSLPATGGASAAGSLVFGVGTQSNNGLNGAQIFTVNNSGYLTTKFNGQTLTSSFIDSGSNGLYFDNSTLPALTACPTPISFFYCPSSTQNYTAVIQGINSNQTTINFSVANASDLFKTGNTAYDDLAGTGIGGFDWGLPFFYGRKVFVVIENQPVGGSVGPFVAF